jgi:hypothetical protein
MKNLGIIMVMIAACFGLIGITQAVSPPVVPPMMIHDEPFIRISFKPDTLDLGAPSLDGNYSQPVQLKAHIVANCPHQVKASFETFKWVRGGGSIRPEHMSVIINGVNVPINKAPVSIISSSKPTPFGGVDVPVDVKFKLDSLMYPAGAYKGALKLTVVPSLN